MMPLARVSTDCLDASMLSIDIYQYPTLTIIIDIGDSPSNIPVFHLFVKFFTASEGWLLSGDLVDLSLFSPVDLVVVEPRVDVVQIVVARNPIISAT